MRPYLRVFFICVLAVTVVATPCIADTILVRQDGSGNATTISEALAMSTAGDEIVIGPGTYLGEYQISHDVALIGEVDASVTILDGQRAGGLMIIDSGATVALSNLTFANAYTPETTAHGAALLVWDGSQVSIDACMFENNESGWDNGALHARGFGTTVTVTGSDFIGNHAVHNGGAVGSGYHAVLDLDGCRFIDNTCSAIAGAVNAYIAELNLHGCLLTGNAAAVGGVILEDSSGVITGCTFDQNVSYDHATVLFYDGSDGQFTHNIVANDAAGGGLKVTSNCEHSCNLYDGNHLGAVIDHPMGPDEVEVPALFCNAASGDYTLCADSPALAVNNGCGDMGAFGMGCEACGVVAVESHSWTTVKEMFD